MQQTIFAHKDQYDRELEWLKLKKFFDKELPAYGHTHVLDLEVSFAYSDEPVPFEEISTLTFEPIKVGDVWAKKNFACAWFHLKGQLPKDMDRKDLYLDFANDGEGYILRMFERTGKAGTANLTLPKGYRLDCEVDLLEEKMGEVSGQLDFRPFQIRSFKVVK
jgi:hypothetical protein